MMRLHFKIAAILAALTFFAGAASAQAQGRTESFQIDGRAFIVPIPPGYHLDSASEDGVTVENDGNNADTIRSGRVGKLESIDGGRSFSAADWPECRKLFKKELERKKKESHKNEKLTAYEFFAETPDSFSVAFAFRLEGVEAYYCVITPQLIGDRAVMSALAMIGLDALKPEAREALKLEALDWRDEIKKANK